MFFFYCIINSIFSFPLNDLIQEWPGLETMPSFKMFSGYIKPSATRHLHYVFLHSERDWKTDPVVVWFNGGPGCSSMDGLLYEHGPFWVNHDGNSFENNKWSWNRVANVLYIESPIGVGYSYSDENKYKMNDESTAKDNADALEYFLDKFPEFVDHDFFIAGESYAGVYVPMLALELMRRGDSTRIKLKRFAVGNGLSSYELNDDSLMFYAYNHGLVPDSLWTSLIENCCSGTATMHNCKFHASRGRICRTHVSEAMTTIYSSGVNFYNLYGKCLSSSPQYELSLESLFTSMHTKLSSARKKHHMKQEHLLQKPHVVPCIDSRGATIWLRKKEVKRALHLHDTPWKWEICSKVLQYSRQKRDMESVYRELFEVHNLEGISYNGDTDMACNFLGNEWFVNSLGRPVTETWTKWSVPKSNQVAGFKMKYDLLTFYTVKGAGHMVPQWAPEASMVILLDLLYGDNEAKWQQASNYIWGGNAGPGYQLRRTHKRTNRTNQYFHDQ